MPNITTDTILKGRKEGASNEWAFYKLSFQRTVILFQLNLFNKDKQKQTQHHFLRKC